MIVEPRSVLGLDTSLTRTGMASLDLERGSILTAAIVTSDRGHRRLQRIVNRITAAARTHDVVAMEGPSYGSHLKGFHEIAGLWWMVRHALWEMQKPVVVIPPAVRAKYASGKGAGPHAAKQHVHQCARELWPHVPLKTNDEADALLLAMIGARVAGRPMDETPDAARWTPVNGLRYAVDPS